MLFFANLICHAPLVNSYSEEHRIFQSSPRKKTLSTRNSSFDFTHEAWYLPDSIGFY